MITFQTDARRRATLPSIIPPNETFEVQVLPDGSFHLVPVALIPKHQLWAWQAEVQVAVAKASKEEGLSLKSPKGKAFLDKLDTE